MKRLTTIACSLVLMLTISLCAVAQNNSKAQKRIAYTVKNLKLNDTQKKAIVPILTSYLTDIKAAKKTYSELKDKYKKDVDKGTLTDKAAQALLEAKFDFDAKETAIKKQYLPKFASAIPYKKVYQCYDLINDKMSKVEGRKSKSNDDDDD